VYIVNQVTKFVTDKDVTDFSFLDDLLLMLILFWGHCSIWKRPEM